MKQAAGSSREWDLEWQLFIERASAQARTLPGQEKLKQLLLPQAWAQDIACAQLWQDQSRELALFCGKESFWAALNGLSDLEIFLLPLKSGSVLGLEEFKILRAAVVAMETWDQYPKEQLPGPLFKAALESLQPVEELLRQLEHLLTPEGEISERASPELARLNREIESIKGQIQRQIEKVVSRFADLGVLQDRFHDVRDGRFVLPVKVSDQSQVEGIIYDASVSGQTVFIEPREIEILNNQLRKAQNERQQEIYRILAKASAWVLSEKEALLSNAEILFYWDGVQARARHGSRYAGKWIEISTDRELSLEGTAHPALWWTMDSSRIVRNTLQMSGRQRALLLTGPNTGGKTVLLKTMGLAGLCARTGFPFPGNASHKIPFFKEFFIDLGDPQNIEAHLSSFSGHVSKMKNILENYSNESLILIDELNTATDPEEGAALGRALLETLIMSEDQGPIVVTTTHDPHLKSLSYMDPELSVRIVSAGMAFDEEKMEPTYKVNLGVPGRSRALEVAERLGMPAQVLKLARQYVSRNHSDFESLLQRLERDLLEAEKARRRAETAEQQAKDLAERWRAKLETAVEQLMEQAGSRIKKLASSAQDEIQNTVKKMKETSTLRKVNEARESLEENLRVLGEKVEEVVESLDPEVAELIKAKKVKQAELEKENQKIIQEGDLVRVPKWRSFGTVLETKGSKFKVRLGVEGVSSGPSMTLQLSAGDIRPINEAEAKELGKAQADINRRIHTSHEADYGNVADQLDLRGERLEDAMKKLEAYLDGAFRAGKPIVRVIHGLGTGALREGTRELLKRLPYVKEFRDGGPSGGGTGATEVELE